MKLNEASAQLNSIAAQWGDAISDRAGTRMGDELLWPHYRPHDARLQATWSSHGAAVGSRQFSFRLLDDALLQMQYRYAGETLTGASLSYLEGPRTSMIRGVDLKDAGQILADAEMGAAPLPDAEPFLLRIDYDPTAARPDHPACHAHLSSLPQARLPVDRLPTPFQFFEFCMHNSLPGVYLDLHGHADLEKHLGRINAIDTGVGCEPHGRIGFGVPGAYSVASDMTKKPWPTGGAEQKIGSAGVAGRAVPKRVRQ